MLHMGQYRKVEVEGAEWPLNRCGSAAGVLWTIQALIGVRRAEGVDGDRSRERYSGLHHETRGSWTGNLKAISGRRSCNFHLTLSLGTKLFTILLSQELQLSVMGEKHSRQWQRRKVMGFPSFFQTKSKNLENVLFIRHNAVLLHTGTWGQFHMSGTLTTLCDNSSPVIPIQDVYFSSSILKRHWKFDNIKFQLWHLMD